MCEKLNTPRNSKFNNKNPCSIFGDFSESTADIAPIVPSIRKPKEINLLFTNDLSSKNMPKTINNCQNEPKTFNFPVISDQKHNDIKEEEINQIEPKPNKFMQKKNKLAMLKNSTQELDTDTINNMFTCGGEIGIRKLNTPENDLLLKEISFLSRNLVYHMDTYEKKQKCNFSNNQSDFSIENWMENRPTSTKNDGKVVNLDIFRPPSVKNGEKIVNIDNFINKKNNVITKHSDDECLGKSLINFEDKIFEKTSKHTKSE